eukprot:TRINITY_DN94990_c0_g1_i1.p1 TRINITY_DN94990_c0_g1~~TRINITY_DN94990_c0_g1_i1.p1  ORF type:complete len:179 (-),score=17.90 TRINITY_DN94990_c0_g1_i1:780-1238(-)
MISKALRESNIAEPIERGVSALLAFHGHNEPEPIEELIEEEQEGLLTIFSRLRQGTGSLPLLVNDREIFSLPLLGINETRDYLTTVERVTGAKDKYAGTVANELIKDFQMATSYPPFERDRISPEELAQMARGLASKIASERENAKVSQEES